MTRIGRRFALSEAPGIGVSCSGSGVFVGTVPLLERIPDFGPGGQGRWQPRLISLLNRDLSACYGLPIEFNRKIYGLQAISRALDRSDLMHAQIATLHLEIPDPPPLTKSAQTLDNFFDLARQLRRSQMLKADWDPEKHPRWPVGSPGGVGGEFAPAGSVFDDTAAGQQSANQDGIAAQEAPVIPAQITIPAPFELPSAIPFPSEIVPPPAIPNTNPRELPKNPYPDRPECEREWAEATRFCFRLKAQNLLGKGDYWGMGRTLSECIMGQVSEDCGGNQTGT